MKNLLLILLAAFTLNASAQWNLKWSHTQSLSAGSFKAAPVSIITDTSGNIYSASNETINPSGDIQGLITKYDAAGNLQWNLPLTPAVSIANDFPTAGLNANNLPAHLNANNLPAHICVVYNTDPSTSHLIKINPNGTIAFNIVLSGINQVSSLYGNDTTYIYVVGKAPQTACGAAMCNGIAVAKYNASGQQVWKKTKYTTGGYFTMPSQIVVDNSGNVIICGKRGVSTAPPTNNFDKTFVVKYSSSGTLLWTKEFTENTTADSKLCIVVDANGDLRFVDSSALDFLLSGDDDDSSRDNTMVADAHPAGMENKNSSSTPTVKVRKLAESNGAVQWTKTLSNAILNGIGTSASGANIIMTSTGMKAYDNAGVLLWSNSLIVGTNQVSTAPPTNNIIAIAKNVSTAPPTNNVLLELNAGTGAILMQKDLSSGSHVQYMGDYGGLNWSGGTQTVNVVISDTTAPYGTMITELSPCSDFTYSYTTSTTVTNVSVSNCNNGQITVSWTGTFNDWPHAELWKGTTKVSEADPTTSPYSFQNLTAATYIVKMFDGSCGEQDTTVTVKCPAPSMGLSTTNIMATSAKANWNAPTCNNGFRIQYRPTTTTTWTTVSGIINFNYVMTGLTGGTGYQWRVATKCNNSGTAVYSNYSVIKTFTTSSPRMGEEAAVSSNSIMNLNIYPNPTNDVLTVETAFENTTPLKIKIMDVTGRELISFTEQAQEGMWQKEINLSKLMKGVYVLRMESEDGMMGVRRFVKE